MSIFECGCVPIKLYFQNPAAGHIWPWVDSFLPSGLDSQSYISMCSEYFTRIFKIGSLKLLYTIFIHSA
jgi:hypothetical protein